MAESKIVQSGVIRTSPHAKGKLDTISIMRNVVYALLPIAGFSIYVFGLSVFFLLTVSVSSCLLTEWLFSRSSPETRGGGGVSDYSCIITGILLALTLPPGFPLWMTAVGGIMSILLGKIVFGGIGFNLFNPALVGRAFLQAAFPVAITTWQAPLGDLRFTQSFHSSLAWPFMKPVWHGVSGATPLSLFKFEGQSSSLPELFGGFVPGAAGETSVVLILVCGLYLALRGMLDWKIPVYYLGTVALISTAFALIDPVRFPSPLLMLGSGGLMLGAVFMATDMVTSPVTRLGVLLFGVILGLLTWSIRVFGGLPEGVMYAILLGNALTPLINKFTKPRVYGT